MIIRIDGKLFTVDPAIRFSHALDVSPAIWNQLWHRYSWLNYRPCDLISYFEIISGKKMHLTTLHRWLFRTKIYHAAQPFVKKSVRTVSTEVFGDLENELIKELTKQFTNSATSRRRIII